MNVLLTGAAGFVGSVILSKLVDLGCFPVAVIKDRQLYGTQAQKTIVKSIDSETVWEGLLAGIDVIIHTAARVHIMRNNSDNPLSEFREVN